MKKALALAILVLVVSCAKEPSFEIIDTTSVPDELFILEECGVKLKSYIVEDQVDMNIKLPETGTYRVKIVDIDGVTVSQEKLQAEGGNNILQVYVKALPKSSYTVEVYTDTDNFIGRDLFSKN